MNPEEAARLIRSQPECLEAGNECEDGTVLHWVSVENKPEVVRVLLANGAQPNSRDDRGDTPLMRASQFGHSEVVKALLEFGADVHARNGEEETALHKAAACMELEAAELLLGAGADVNALDELGASPLLHAVAMAAVVTRPLASLLNLPANLRARLEKGAEQDPTVKEKEAKRRAAPQREAAMVRLLLQHGADPYPSGAYQSAAHEAARKAHSNPGLLTALLEHECDLTALDLSGRSVASCIHDEARATFRAAFAARGIQL